MNVKEVMKTLETMGSEQTRKIYRRHGMDGPIFGVKVGDLKTIVKKVKKDYILAKELFATGNGDAMYLAGLIADETKMTKKDLESWVKASKWYMTSEFSVPWVTAETPYAEELADKWIMGKKDNIISSGWATWACICTLRSDDTLDQKKLKTLVDQVVKTIDDAPNRARYAMNGFVLSVGGTVAPLTAYAMKAAEKIGKVEVSMGETACKVPFVPTYLEKMKEKGRIGKKKKTCRC